MRKQREGEREGGSSTSIKIDDLVQVGGLCFNHHNTMPAGDANESRVGWGWVLSCSSSSRVLVKKSERIKTSSEYGRD